MVRSLSILTALYRAFLIRIGMAHIVPTMIAIAIVTQVTERTCPVDEHMRTFRIAYGTVTLHPIASPGVAVQLPMANITLLRARHLGMVCPVRTFRSANQARTTVSVRRVIDPAVILIGGFEAASYATSTTLHRSSRVVFRAGRFTNRTLAVCPITVRTLRAALRTNTLRSANFRIIMLANALEIRQRESADSTFPIRIFKACCRMRAGRLASTAFALGVVADVIVRRVIPAEFAGLSAIHISVFAISVMLSNFRTSGRVIQRRASDSAEIASVVFV